MDIQEAIEHLNDVLNDDDRWTGCAECKEEHEQLREFLEELQQYRQIGTVDECRAAAEKQIAKTPLYTGQEYDDEKMTYEWWSCPNCGTSYQIGIHTYDFCHDCGQHIQHEDWESE